MQTARRQAQRSPLIWYLFPSHLLVILATVLIVMLYTTRSLERFLLEQTEADLANRARVLTEVLQPKLDANLLDDMQALCRTLGSETATRITVVLPSGRVAADSQEAPEHMENHGQRPEIVAALRANRGVAERYSATLHQNMVYVAMPLRDGARVAGVLRVSVPITRIEAALRRVYPRMALTGLVMVLFAAMLSGYVSHRLTRAVEAMKHGAERFAHGDFSQPLVPPASREMASLAEALNQMARQLDDRIQTVLNQRNHQEAVLSSMVEGVLAIDIDRRIISLNEAAAGLIGARVETALNRPIEEIVRNDALRQFVLQSIENPAPSESELILEDRNQQILQIHSAALRDTQGNWIGAVAVLNDVTRLRRLEQVRSDFVANVSHELRTPITSIKGFVETLIDGALESPEDARRFLGIVAKQADRLNAILSDLLTLSRIEEGEKRADIQLEEGPIRDVLLSAMQICEHKAAEKDIRLALECPDGLVARVNASLLEQAVSNLIDNAVKYSEPGGEVCVRVDQEDGEVVIRVRDQGCGIPPEHHPRLFERFYRVDKARSRSLGGTGLGLSIVKHIAKTHGGRVSVESTPGVGSTFAIHLPGSGG